MDTTVSLDLSKLTKAELLIKCDEIGLTKVKSKTKPELIALLSAKNIVINDEKIVIEDALDSDCESEEDSHLDDNIIIENDITIDVESESKLDLTGYKFIDLFCGIGGFHQALHQMGATCVLACDIDKECRIVYKDNYGIEPVSNVKDIDEKTMDDFDILCAGFPCQAFSNGGKKKCFDDERGLLFDEIVRIAKAKKPRFMFLENVKHILKVSNGEVIEYIKNKLFLT